MNTDDHAAPDPEPAADAIVVAYTWTADELGESQKLYAKAQPLVRKLASVALGGGFAAYGVYTLWQWQGDSTSLISGLVLILAGAFLMALRTVFAVWIVKRRHARRPDAQHALTHSVDDAAVHTVVPGLARSRVTWEHFVRAVVGERGTLLFLTPQQYQWLPSHPLSADERARLDALVASKVARVDRI